ncbi:MAG: 50S ribosomal protein L9 [Gammaproteobacteria bacterium]
MQVILLEKIHNLGNIGDLINVAPGYGRNYLLRQKKAIPATDENIQEFQQRRAQLEAKAAENLVLAKQRAEKLQLLSIKIEARASDEGKLFGSVGTSEIVTAFKQQGEEVEKREILLPEGKPIHEIGEHTVRIQVHSDVIAEIKVNILGVE